jgi:hypothetical protein
VTPTTRANLDAALRVTNGQMPINVSVSPDERAKAEAYIKGKFGAKAIRIIAKVGEK